ncbi:MAG: hypothetical protein WB764_30680 [Xanthobacteraceae bacterium]
MRTAPTATAAIAATLAVTLIVTGSGFAQTDPNLAMNNPDQQAWTLFLAVNADAKTAGNNNALFETWARDGETFVPNPVWPTTPTPVATGERALGLVLQQAHSGGPLRFAVPGGNATEETRRNKPDFDFIVANNLYKVSGLKAAFAANKPLSFPVGAMEVKANWVEVSGLKAFNGFTGTPEDAAKLYHVNSAGGKQYALVSMHVISKLVPNWTWATFEHKDNPGRCDVIGCKDMFGAQTPVLPSQSPTEPSQQHYADCVKTPALTAMFAAAHLDPAYVNYCLKGSQTDFTDATGLAIRLGNSVTEKFFVNQASCMTCHGRAAFDSTGKATSFAGFDPISINLPPPQNTGNGPVGPINPNWYWIAGGPPSYPVLAGESDIQPIALAADFVWSIPFCAIDDTANPPETKSKFCGNK